jgi:acetyl esterase/lipase
MKTNDSWKLAALLVAAGWFGGRMVAAEPVIDLWPEGVPGLRADATAEKTENELVSNVHRPTLTWYAPPAGRATGAAVIICPGGGYSVLAWDKEGVEPARWLNSLGLTAFVLKYRLLEYGQPAPLQDVLRAVRLVRSRAVGYGIKPDRLGVMGFSAGGHVAACAGTLYDLPGGRTGAALDAVSARPDFLLLIYPVLTMKDPFTHAGSRSNLLGPAPVPELVERYSTELHVNQNTPPAFLLTTFEDRVVPAENCLEFFEAMHRAGVPAELHAYEKGPHGFGLRPGAGPVSEWPAVCGQWLRLHGWAD